mmetsp:Transcript_11830/g.27858  ORF Transcript_11830/g.27858 Transcript_11830/m.27858 type:complete len:170 (+) Transcript_11830:119-628(+)
MAESEPDLSCRLPAKLSEEEKSEILSKISLEDRAEFFKLSCCPITAEAEQRMEQVSFVVTQENLGPMFDDGLYSCARCKSELYRSSEKFEGPCMWPSFREASSAEGLERREVRGYNHYTCTTVELYCRSCQLFLGHAFEDGGSSGDVHPAARWRHCVLSLSLLFAPARP